MWSEFRYIYLHVFLIYTLTYNENVYVINNCICDADRTIDGSIRPDRPNGALFHDVLGASIDPQHFAFYKYPTDSTLILIIAIIKTYIYILNFTLTAPSPCPATRRSSDSHSVPLLRSSPDRPDRIVRPDRGLVPHWWHADARRPFCCRTERCPVFRSRHGHAADRSSWRSRGTNVHWSDRKWVGSPLHRGRRQWSDCGIYAYNENNA